VIAVVIEDILHEPLFCLEFFVHTNWFSDDFADKHPSVVYNYTQRCSVGWGWASDAVAPGSSVKGAV